MQWRKKGEEAEAMKDMATTGAAIVTGTTGETMITTGIVTITIITGGATCMFITTTVIVVTGPW